MRKLSKSPRRKNAASDSRSLFELNLRALRNGVRNVLVRTEVPSGTYRQVRVVITGAYLRLTNGNEYSTEDDTLHLTSQDTSGFKFFIDPAVDVQDGFSRTLLLDADLSGSVHEALVALGRRPIRGSATLSAQSATEEDARELDVPAGSALLVEQRLILDQQQRPVELSESRYAGSRYRLDVAFGVEPH